MFFHIKDYILKKIWQLQLFLQSIFRPAKMFSPGKKWTPFIKITFLWQLIALLSRGKFLCDHLWIIHGKILDTMNSDFFQLILINFLTLTWCITFAMSYFLKNNGVVFLISEVFIYWGVIQDVRSNNIFHNILKHLFQLNTAWSICRLKRCLLKCQSHKMVKHTQTIRRLIDDFVGLALKRSSSVSSIWLDTVCFCLVQCSLQ